MPMWPARFSDKVALALTAPAVQAADGSRPGAPRDVRLARSLDLERRILRHRQPLSNHDRSGVEGRRGKLRSDEDLARPGRETDGRRPSGGVVQHEKGRVFVTLLGHDVEMYRDERHLQHLLGRIYWTATGLGQQHRFVE